MTIWQNDCQIDPLALAQGQKPFAATLFCPDSRVDPAWLFSCGSGELFQVRSAGNTAFDQAIASMEYAVSVLEVPSGGDGAQQLRSREGGDRLRAAHAAAGRARGPDPSQLTARIAVLKDAVAAGSAQPRR